MIEYVALMLRTNWEESFPTDADGTFYIGDLPPGIHVTYGATPDGEVLLGERNYHLGTLNLGVMEDILMFPLTRSPQAVGEIQTGF